MKDLMTMQQFIDKCGWEGGDLVAGFEYGLRSTHLDNDCPLFKKLVCEAENHWEEFKKVQTLIEKYGEWE